MQQRRGSDLVGLPSARSPDFEKLRVRYAFCRTTRNSACDRSSPLQQPQRIPSVGHGQIAGRTAYRIVQSEPLIITGRGQMHKNRRQRQLAQRQNAFARQTRNGQHGFHGWNFRADRFPDRLVTEVAEAYHNHRAEQSRRSRFAGSSMRSTRLAQKAAGSAGLLRSQLCVIRNPLIVKKRHADRARLAGERRCAHCRQNRQRLTLIATLRFRAAKQCENNTAYRPQPGARCRSCS